MTKGQREKKKLRDIKYQEAHKEKLKAYRQEYYLKNRDKIIEKNLAYSKANPEVSRKSGRKFRGANKEKIAIVHKAWRLKNKHKQRLYKQGYYKVEKDFLKEYRRQKLYGISSEAQRAL